MEKSKTGSWGRPKVNNCINLLYTTVSAVTFNNISLIIIGLMFVLITMIICGTVLWALHKKIKSQEQQHSAKLKEAEEIKEKYYKPDIVKICIKTNTGKKK